MIARAPVTAVGALVVASILLAPLSDARGQVTRQIVRLTDGTELVVASIPGARTVSMRYVVHAGSGADPAGSPGLAHLLEHLIFHGSAETSQREIFRAARARGAHINGLTRPDSTHYVVDVRDEEADATIEMIIRAITSPFLPPASIEVERRVVRAESELSPSADIYRIMTLMLVPAFRTQAAIVPGRTDGQTDRSRLIDFYNRHYRPSNTTIVFAGAVEIDRARKLIESASRLAPDDGPVPRAAPTTGLSTPVEATVPAPIYLVLFGYDLSGADASTCRGLADLIDLRLDDALVIQRPISPQVATACIRLGGHQLIATIALSRSYSGAQLRVEIERGYRQAKSRALSSAERTHLERRAELERARRLADPAELADTLARELAPDRPGADHQEAFQAVFERVVLDGPAMQRTAAHFFEDSRRVVINAAPF